MGVTQEIDHRASKDSGAEKLTGNSDANGIALDAGKIWMTLAAAHDHGQKSPRIPGLPDLDVHSKAESNPDNKGHHTVAEEMLDDLNTLMQTNGKVDVLNQQAAKSLDGTHKNGDLPVIQTDKLPPGKIGIIMTKNPDGHTYYTPFISAGGDAQARPDSSIKINDSAARELKIDEALKKGQNPKLDIFAFNLEDDERHGIIMPRTKDDLHELVLEKLHNLAEDERERIALERVKEQQTRPEAPKPDPEFGYRRTERSPEELRKISEDFAKQARAFMDAAEPAGIQERMKAAEQQAQKEITQYQGELNKKAAEETRAVREASRLEKQAQQILNPESDKAKKLAPRVSAAQEKAEAATTAKQLADYNLSYAQQELRISKDEALFTRHMQAKASAAAIMSLNPDMEGALKGHRFVLNAGHYPEDPKFPGFEYDGTAEWKLNHESEDVAGAMVKMAGGAVKLVNQADLKDRTMTGLANAIKAAKPEVAVGIHHDDGENREADIMKGTLTLECGKTTGAWSTDFANAAHMAKLNYAGLPEKVNKNGVPVGIREQCGRGVQGRNVGAPFILDEQLSTQKDMWKLARDPKANAQIQFARVVAFYEYVNKMPRYKTTPDTAQEYKDKIWSKTTVDDVFKRHPKVGDW